MKASDPDTGLTREAALRCIPVRNADVQEERLPSGDLLLTHPVTLRPWMAAVVRRLGREEQSVRLKKLQLDGLGTDVWDLLDGRRTVERVIQEFTEKYQLHAKEAEVAVTRFLRELGRRGLIGMK